MNDFEKFLIALLKAVFNDYPYNKARSKKSFEIIKAQTKNDNIGDKNGLQN